MKGRRRALLAGAGLLAAVALWQLGAAGRIQAKAWLAQHLIANAWAETLAGAERARPWPWADTWPVARLTVPRLQLERIVLAGASGRTLAFGPGHQDGSALPGGAGASVIAGHRDTHMRFLKDLKPGDRLALEDRAGARHLYRVRESLIVHHARARLDSADPTPRLVLVTCYPFDALIPGGPLRYVVVAEREQPPPTSAALPRDRSRAARSRPM